MSAIHLLLHNYRLRRIRWAMQTLNRRIEAYERAYGCAPFLWNTDAQD